MIDNLSWVVIGIAIGLLLHEFVLREQDTTDRSDEDVPIIDPDDRFDTFK